MMQIIDHLLWLNSSKPARQELSPNGGGLIYPRFLILHYTVILGLEECVQWFLDSDRQVSAHFVVGRQGEIVQMMPCNQKAWHCGASRWGEFEGLNSHSIGIEMVCAGKLSTKDEQYMSWFDQCISKDEVIWAQHQNEFEIAPWQIYTREQLKSVESLAQVLDQTYHFDAILGHDEIAPNRKIDPGPAFDMDAFRAKLSR